MSKQKFYISSIFDEPVQYQLDEALGTSENKSKVDGEFIIGKVEGPGFVPEGFSRNKRFYPKSLWERVISDPEVRKGLENSTMFGCIGHSSGPVTEEDLSTGKVSHFVDDLWIDPQSNLGMVRYYILNTPAGKNLKTYLKAGCKLKTSTRGEGDFLEGETKDDCPIINPESYKLYTVDFVIEPGFIETGAELTENYIEEVLITDKTDNLKGGKDEMNLEETLKECESERDALKQEVSEMLERHSEEKKKLEAAKAGLQERLSKSFQKRAKLEKALAKETHLRKKLAEGVNQYRKELSDYRELGTVEVISKGAEIAENLLVELNQFKELGSVSEFKSLKRQVESLKVTLGRYRSLGSLNEISKLIKLSENYFELKEKRTISESAKELSKTYGLPIEKVAESLATKGEKETVAMLEASASEKVVKEEKINSIVETEQNAVVKPEKTVSICEGIFSDWEKTHIINEDEKDDKDADVLNSIDFNEIPMSALSFEDDEEEELDPLTRLDNLEAKVDDLEGEVAEITGETEEEETEDVEAEGEETDIDEE